MYYLCAISELPSFTKYYQVLNLLNFGTLCDTFLILGILEKIKKKSDQISLAVMTNHYIIIYNNLLFPFFIFYYLKTNHYIIIYNN